METAIPSLAAASDSVAAVSSAAAEFAGSAMSALEPVISAFNQMPGSAIVLRYVTSSYRNDPVRSCVELVLFLFAVRYMLSPKYSTSHTHKGTSDELTEKEIEELIKEWSPDPLVAPLTTFEKNVLDHAPVLVRAADGKAFQKGRPHPMVNLGSDDIYSLATTDRLKANAIEALRMYGVGPCGPPGFYATQDAHIQAESCVSKHIGTDACIIYAQSFSTISSAIPAFCKRGDVIVADRAVNYSVFKGVQISRSTVHWYRHNDLEDLERILAQVANEQRKKKILTRRFIVTEALFESTGNMVDLPALVRLKKKYKFRLVLDEKNSYGVLGKTGAGLTEAESVDPRDIDMIIGSLSSAIPTAGGFCAASKEVVEHQRLNAASYTFSAALPAMMATTACETIDVTLKSASKTGLFEAVKTNVRAFRSRFGADRSKDGVAVVDVLGWEENPSVLLSVSESVVDRLGLSDDELEGIIFEVVRRCLDQSVIVTQLKDLPLPPETKADDLIRSAAPWRPRPAVKARISVRLTKDAIEGAADTIRTAFEHVLANYQSSR